MAALPPTMDLHLLASVASAERAGRARTHAMVDEYRNLLYAHQTDMNEFLYNLKLLDEYDPNSFSNMYDVILIGTAASDGTGDILLHKKIMDAVRRIARTLTYVFNVATAMAGHRNEFVQQNQNLYNDFEHAQLSAAAAGRPFVNCIKMPELTVLEEIPNNQSIIDLVNQAPTPYVIFTSALTYSHMADAYKKARRKYKSNARFLYLGECGVPTFSEDIDDLPAVSLGFSKASLGMYYIKPNEFRYDMRQVKRGFLLPPKTFIFNHFKVSEEMYNDERMVGPSKTKYDLITNFVDPIEVIYKLIIFEIFICMDLEQHHATILSIVPDNFYLDIVDDYEEDDEDDKRKNIFRTMNLYIGNEFNIKVNSENKSVIIATVEHFKYDNKYTLIFHKQRLNQDTFNYLMFNSMNFVGVTGHNTFLMALSMHKIPLYDCLFHSIPCFDGFTELVNRFVRRDLNVSKLSNRYVKHTNIYHIMDKYICTNAKVPATFLHVTPFNLNTKTFIEVFEKIFNSNILDFKFNIEDNLPLLLAGVPSA